MTIKRDDVERIARLAALDVDEEAMPVLTRQIGRILEYVSQLDRLKLAADAPAWLGTTRPQPLRTDEVRPPDLQRPIQEFATAFRDDLFLVPRLAAMEDE
jgi:aspartyl-tRNA(Asn)/glutamyl-tRNA(Gln) amidotransferase subunit C